MSNIIILAHTTRSHQNSRMKCIYCFIEKPIKEMRRMEINDRIAGHVCDKCYEERGEVMNNYGR